MKDSIFWSIFQTDPVQCLWIYGIIFISLFTGLIWKSFSKKRSGWFLVGGSILAFCAITWLFIRSFIYTESESVGIVQNLALGIVSYDQVQFEGDVLPRFDEEFQIDVVDEFWGTWDIKLVTESKAEWIINVTKDSDDWVIHSQKATTANK